MHDSGDEENNGRIGLNRKACFDINMSIFYRREYYREKLFLKNLHLKSCKKKLQEILSQNFSDDDFVEAFKECFPHLWEDIKFFCDIRKSNYLRRKKKGLRTVPYLYPKKYLLKHCRCNRKIVSQLSLEEKLKRKHLFVEIGQKKLQKRKEKLANNLVYVQEVCPSYVKELIRTYFQIRKKQTLDVNVRYLILLEASMFKCSETLSFLYEIAACDKNYDLRLMAFYALQRMGEHPWLGRGRKGKKHLSQLKKIDIQKNPTALLEQISKYQSLLFQRYDIFLSHSSLDEKELLRIKSVLNLQGYTVYIDWVNDREMLNRKNQDNNTWNALQMRMDQSNRLLYVMTDNSINSIYTKKEVLYFKEKHKPVFVYQPTGILNKKPDYLDGCEEIKDICPISFN